MSLQTFEESGKTASTIPADKNVRVLITGLAFCDFTRPLSKIEFLRKIPHHELLMTITQLKRNDGNYKKSLTLKLDDNQDIEILGANKNSTSDQLRGVVGMKTMHGNKINRKTSANLTSLVLSECNFFTHKLTDSEFIFDDTNGTTIPAQKYCEIIGGDMNFTDSFTISIKNSFPFTFPLTDDFIYEITFINSCDSTPTCRNEEDFKYMYNFVEESGNPNRRFKMIEVKIEKSTGTGACLPVCEEC